MSEKPNIVIIMTDQQRADVCAREGFALDTTPYLDELANQGVWFNRAIQRHPHACAGEHVHRAIPHGHEDILQPECWRRL